MFTPLLPSTAVGTLEFRCIQEPVRRLEGVSYDQAKARSIDVVRGTVQAEDIFPHSRGGFEQPFDKLVIAVGCKTNTFHTPGVLEREGREVFFLKHLYHARQIRSRTVDCFERADIPGTPEAEIDRLLHFVVVGGGPT